MPPIGIEGRPFVLAGERQPNCDLAPGESRHFELLTLRDDSSALMLSGTPGGWSFHGTSVQLNVRATQEAGPSSEVISLEFEQDSAASPPHWIHRP